MRTYSLRVAATALLLSAGTRIMAAEHPLAAEHPPVLGFFEGRSDIGGSAPPAASSAASAHALPSTALRSSTGSAAYDPVSNVYTLTSAGANTWYHVDNFTYLWKKASGDLALTADISFPRHTYSHDPNPHRKGILMFRQALGAGAAYAAVGAHGSGMTALQYRRVRGDDTEDIELNVDAPKTVRIEKRGDTFTLFLSMHGESLHQAGASVTLHLKAPFYVGLGALSHDVATTDKVEFSRVAIEPLSPLSPASKPVLYSTLLTIQTEDQFRRAMMIRTLPGLVQSANWAPGGKSIYIHESGRIVKIPYLTPEAGGIPQPIDTGTLVDCSGNFGLSPDGKLLAVSCAETPGGSHQVYLLPASGGAPRKLTQGAVQSFFHAWSPDSRTIAFTRGSAGKADIFTIPASGGIELRLTDDTRNDGPDYAPDGKFIYFDSSRSGTTQIWRMQPDGTAAEQITDDAGLNSSPHVSPDGKTLAFLNQPLHTGPGIGDAALRTMVFSDGLIRTLTEFQGDRDSFSMYGWGDANHLAFVSYQMLPGETHDLTKGTRSQ